MQPCKAKYMWSVWNIIALLTVEETSTDKVVSGLRVKNKD